MAYPSNPSPLKRKYNGQTPKQTYQQYRSWGASHMDAVMTMLFHHSASKREYGRRIRRLRNVWHKTHSAFLTISQDLVDETIYVFVLDGHMRLIYKAQAPAGQDHLQNLIMVAHETVKALGYQPYLWAS